MLDIKKYSDVEKPLDCTPAKGRKIEYIVLHYDAGVSISDTPAKNNCKWWNSDPGQASADFVVDENEIWQYNPDLDNYYCWHCGGKKLAYGNTPYYGIATNKNTIGIEMCSYREDKNNKATAEADGWLISDKVLAKTQELVKFLRSKYNIKPENVITHFDVSGKLCPRPFVKRDSTGSWSIIENYMAPFRTDKLDDKAVTSSLLTDFMSTVPNNDGSILNFEISRYDQDTNNMLVISYGNDLTKLLEIYNISTITSNDNFLSFTTQRGDLYVIRKKSISVF